VSLHNTSSDDGIIIEKGGTYYKLDVPQMHNVEKLVVVWKPSVGVRQFDFYIGRELVMIIQVCDGLSQGEHSHRDSHLQISTPVNITWGNSAAISEALDNQSAPASGKTDIITIKEYRNQYPLPRISKWHQWIEREDGLTSTLSATRIFSEDFRNGTIIVCPDHLLQNNMHLSRGSVSSRAISRSLWPDH
jgi:hypothetical protein